MIILLNKVVIKSNMSNLMHIQDEMVYLFSSQMRHPEAKLLNYTKCHKQQIYRIVKSRREMHQITKHKNTSQYCVRKYASYLRWDGRSLICSISDVDKQCVIWDNISFINNSSANTEINEHFYVTHSLCLLAFLLVL